jgi:large subunit ribosomal protein L10
MSKAIKQMEMDTLRGTFASVRDLVVLHVKGLNSVGDYALRSTMRKKKIRLQVVKTALCRRVFHDLGMKIPDDSPYWKDTTVMAWSTGDSAIAELSKEIEAELKNPKTQSLYKDKVTIKGAIAEGQPVDFELAKKIPTRQEAIAELLGLILSPAAYIAGCLVSPGGQVAGCVASISEKKEETAA